MNEILRKFFITLSLILSFSLGFFSSQYAIEYYYSTKFKAFYWERDPILIICPSSKYTEANIKNALEFWEPKGYSVAFVHKDQNGTICKEETLEGFIFIRDNLGGVGTDAYAVTRRYSKRNQLVFAEIQVPNQNIYMPLLLEHEIGHAFGFTHYNKSNHIMNESYHRMGKEFYYPE